MQALEFGPCAVLGMCVHGRLALSSMLSRIRTLDVWSTPLWLSCQAPVSLTCLGLLTVVSPQQPSPSPGGGGSERLRGVAEVTSGSAQGDDAAARMGRTALSLTCPGKTHV